MTKLPFITLHTADSELDPDAPPSGPIRVNAKLIVDHCQQMVPHQTPTALTTALIFPAGLAGLHVKESIDEIEAAMLEALRDDEDG